MITRLFFTFRSAAFSFAIVLAAFFLYSILIVPWIEPSAAQRRSLLPPAKYRNGSAHRIRSRQLEALFAEGSWELDNPRVLEIDRGMLILKDYETLEDGRLKIEPCTVVLQSADDSDPSAKPARPIVLQAPRGATIRFDKPINFARAQVGKFESGELAGPITIRSPESQHGADDALLVRTNNVEILKDRILAPNDISFRFGRNFGDGRDLTVFFDDITGKSENDGQQKGLEKLQRLELKRVNEIHLAVDQSNPLPSHNKKRQRQTPATPHKSEITVTCRGPFRIDFPRGLASFEDRVDIVRTNPQGPDDDLNCQVLTIEFVAHQKGKNSDSTDRENGDENSGSESFGNFDVQRLVAKGMPAVLQMPSQQASVRGEWLEYDLKSQRVRVRDQNKVQLSYQDSVVEARDVQYELGKEGRLGQLWAEGPGFIRGELTASDGEKTFDAQWNDRLILQRDADDHVLSIVSGASVKYHGMGEFTADSIHVWLSELQQHAKAAGGKTKFTYRPNRMLAESNVKIDSWQLSGETQKAEIWIRYDGPTKDKADSAGRKPSNPLVGDPGKPSERVQKFDVRGERIQAQLVRNATKTSVEHLVIDGNVRFREIRTAKPEELPFSIAGDLLQLHDATSDNGTVVVQGQPAEVAARGMTMQGPNIQLDRGQNQMWIVGPGTMSLPADRVRAPSLGPDVPLGDSGRPVKVGWKGRMDFDGRKVIFNRDVQVSSRQLTQDGEMMDMLVMGHHLEATLNQKVDFSQTKQPADVDVQTLAFKGGVYLQNDGSRSGLRTSHEEMQVRDLTLNQATGRLKAFGPGWASSVRFGEGTASVTPPGADGLNPPQKPGLTFVRVDFEDQMIGKMATRQVEFFGRVRTIYGPVANWEQKLSSDPHDGLAVDQYLLSSDRLAVTQMIAGSDGRQRAIEVEATSNATIEGRTFTARGARIAYAHGKRMVILEGDGRGDAELWLRGSTNPDATAQGIRFWTDTQRFDVYGGRQFNLSRAPENLR